MIICGIMTGTSLDGIDIALCDFGAQPNISNDYRLLFSDSLHFSDEFRMELQAIIESGNIGLKTLSQLNFRYSRVIADAVINVFDKNDARIDIVDYFALHGQTIWHNPIKEQYLGEPTSSTFQMGSASALSAFLLKPVVFDFRAADVALGGEGAPLVPIFDYYFLRNDTENVVALNIGGISNITILPKKCNIDDIMAFDVGPGNTLIDNAMLKLYGTPFDYNGEIAKGGEVLAELYEELCEMEFISQKPPKSTGRELFNLNLIDTNVFDNKREDIIRTLTEFTVYCIATNIKQFAADADKIIVSGGGSRNGFMLELLINALANKKVVVSDKIGIPSDSKEAIAFAYLAWRTVNKLYGNIPSVTGASGRVVLGAIASNY